MEVFVRALDRDDGSASDVDMLRSGRSVVTCLQSSQVFWNLCKCQNDQTPFQAAFIKGLPWICGTSSEFYSIKEVSQNSSRMIDLSLSVLELTSYWKSCSIRVHNSCWIYSSFSQRHFKKPKQNEPSLNKLLIQFLRLAGLFIPVREIGTPSKRDFL